MGKIQEPTLYVPKSARIKLEEVYPAIWGQDKGDEDGIDIQKGIQADPNQVQLSVAEINNIMFRRFATFEFFGGIRTKDDKPEMPAGETVWRSWMQSNANPIYLVMEDDKYEDIFVMLKAFRMMITLIGRMEECKLTKRVRREFKKIWRI
jgi:hypothetical protein